MIDLPALAARLNDAGLLNKSFMDMTKSEILAMVTAVFSSPGDEVPAEGWQKPCIVNEQLVIQFNAHPKYRWWEMGGQSLLDTLIELDAPFPVANKYFSNIGITSMTEEQYMNRVIPF